MLNSPFEILAKVPFTGHIMEEQYLKRARQIVKKISPYVKKNDDVLDIGCGTGYVSKILSEKISPKLTLIDVKKNYLCKTMPVTLYNGKKIPFPDNHFDSSLLIAVLHHCPKPLSVLDEAIRVSTKRIIIMEDLFESAIEKTITLFEDSFVNWEFKNHPHSNKTEEEWVKVFKDKNLEIENFQKFKLVCAGFPFRLGIFILNKKK